MRNSSGDPIVGADTASCVAMGVANKAVTSAGSNSTKYVDIEYGHEEWFPSAGTFTKASVGENVAVADDTTINTQLASSNDVLLGRLVQLETVNGTAGGWVRICEFA
jgi:hypothetical protein